MPIPPAPPADVEAALDEYRARARDELVDYFPAGEPRRWLYDLLPDYPLRAGKGLRPALCIATCRAFGGSLSGALHSAVAVEMLHNAFLVHDDIQDGSGRRRGRPSLPAEQGMPIALNVGDMLALLCVEPLVDNFVRVGPAALPILRRFSATIRETLEGQAIELGWIRDNVLELGPEDYLRMALKKTSWYSFILPCQAGALAAWSLVGSNRFIDFGFYFGAMFQIQDDLLNVLPGGDSGEEYLSDLFEGKRTLMLIHVYSNARDDDKRFLRRLYGRPRAERGMDDIRRVLRLMVEHQSIEFARAALRYMEDEAIEAFDVAFDGVADSEDSRFIRGLIPYLLLSRPAALHAVVPSG